MTDQPWLLQSPVEPGWTAPRRGPRDIHRFVWDLWPWMNWLLPVVAIFFVGNGGWALMALLLFSPLLVPAAGLLGSLPRFILRKSGRTTTPAPVTTLLFVQWWAWAAAMITPPGATDGSPIPAVMQAFSARPISGGFLYAVMLTASGVAVACWIAVLVIAIVTSTRSPARASSPWTVVAWIAAFVLPLLYVAMIWLGGVVTAQQRDAAGVTVAEAQARPLSVQTQEAQERYERAQSQLSIVRGLLAEDGWAEPSWGIDHRTTFSDAVESYGFDLEFEHEPLAAGAVDVEAVEAELRRQGWVDGERGTIVDPEGNAVEILETEHVLTVSLTSPTWWGDAYELSDELDDQRGDDLEAVLARRAAAALTYAFDEWPLLS
ncbi:hypothetical protein ACI2IP_09065 [Microbacterium sp. NPDC090218]